MNRKTGWQPRIRKMLVVVPINSYTWAVAFSRRLIPGAVFSTRAAAVLYAAILATAAGIDASHVRVLGTA